MEELMNLHFSNILWAIGLPLVLMVLDIITGYYRAWKDNRISSSKMRDGLGKKCAELCYIILGVACKLAFKVDIVMHFLVIYVCYMEVVSLFENCDNLGFPIPDRIRIKLNNKEEK